VPRLHLALQSAHDLSVPISVAAIVVLFLIAQARVDARDPKLVDAPVGADDDMVGFT
jgi:hypothetical protein